MRTALLRAIAVSSACVCITSAAMAQRAGTDPAAAEKLFTEARKLVDAGKYAEACPKFADSQKLDPAVGTLLNLAQCYEKLGKTATAWATYREAAAAARNAGQGEREKKATRSADTIEPEVPKLTVTVPDAAVAKGVEVKRYGNGLPTSLWGVAVPVDPGEYVIEARAPGAKPWTTRVKAEPGRSVAVVLPPFEEASPSAPAAAPAPSATSPNSLTKVTDTSTSLDSHSSGLNGQRVTALIIGGTGLVLAGVGTVFALTANSQYNTVHCSPDNFCDPQGLSERDDAKKSANIATLTMALGGVAFATGAVLYLTAPTSSSTGASSAPRLAVSGGALPGGASVALRGNW